MDILDLDEAQGLTAEIARAYLERTAWTIATLALQLVAFDHGVPQAVPW